MPPPPPPEPSMPTSFIVCIVMWIIHGLILGVQGKMPEPFPSLGML